jgi:hypothetical protein
LPGETRACSCQTDRLSRGCPPINTTPFTDAQRKRFQPKQPKKIKSFAPTVQKVKEIVPNKLIPKLKPTMPMK